MKNTGSIIITHSIVGFPSQRDLVHCLVYVALSRFYSGNEYREGVACLNGESHDRTEVLATVSIQERRVSDLLESQLRGNCCAGEIVVEDIQIIKIMKSNREYI